MHQEVSFLAAGGILCFTPLTLYLFWLAAVNRGDRPVVVSGAWDFVALLAGLFGFIVCAGIVLTATGLNLNLFRRGGFAELKDAVVSAQRVAALVPVGYALLVGLGILATLRSRSRSLAVYNIHPPAAERALDELFAKLNVPAKRFGYRWSGERPLADLAVFHVFSHATVKLLSKDRRLCEECERELRASLPKQPAGENPAGPWLTTAAVSCFITTLCCVVLTFVASFNR